MSVNEYCTVKALVRVKRYATKENKGRDTLPEQDALQCEGQCEGITCQMWYHRYCAGVPLSHFKDLANSEKPFVCLLCSQDVHKAVVSQLQSEIAALKAEQQAHPVHELQSMVRSLVEEVRELKVTVAVLRSSNSNSCLEGVECSDGEGKLPWNVVVSGGKRGKRLGKGPPGGSGYKPKGSSNAQKVACQGLAPPSGKATNSNADGPSEQGHVHRNRIPVKGARKVWGTLRSTTTLAVENALKTLTSINTKGLAVKRKFKTARNDKDQVTKWWFVVRGEESVLEQLQNKWSAISVQTLWRLEPVLSYGDDPVGPATEQVHSVAAEDLNSEEQPGQQPTPLQPVSQHLPVSPVTSHPLVIRPQGVSPLRQVD